MNIVPQRMVCHTAYLMCVFAMMAICRRSHAAFDELPLELRSYRVQMLVAFDDPQLSKTRRTELVEATRLVARRCLGSQWDLTLAEADWVQPVSPDGLSRLTLDKICGRLQQEPHQFDVRLVATLRSTGMGWRISARSWQPEVGVTSDVVEADALDRQDLPLILLQLCHAAFRPFGIVDDVDGKQVKVILQAGGLQVPDDSFSLTRSAQLLVPVLVSRKRDKTIERQQAIPWTLLKYVETDGARLTCELHSGLRSPIGGKQRGRVQTMVVATKASTQTTLLELATQSKPSLPLVAHRIELRRTAEIARAEEAHDKDDRLLKVLLTDRRGHVTIPAEMSGSVVWLFAYSGTHLLARVPFVPGTSAALRLEVPDDSVRLEAESNLQMLQGELIEAVAARNTVAARIRAAVKKNDGDQAKAAAMELKKLPDAQVYLNRVIAIRVPSVKAAKARRDRAGEARVNRMCDEMAELIKQYLSEDKRAAALEIMKELLTEDPATEKPNDPASQ